MGPLLTKKNLSHHRQSLFPPVSLSYLPGQNEEECENVTPPCQFESAPHRLMCPSISLHRPPPPSSSQAALLLWSRSEGRSYYRHRAQVRMASRQHTIKA